MTSIITRNEIDWPPSEKIAADRVIEGTPAASTVETASTPAAETGLWRVSEGEFTTAHHGYIEFIHILDGEGYLVHDNGTTLPLGPGTTITMDDGWSGRWVILRELTKAYAILRTDS